MNMTNFFKVKGYISVNQVPGKVLKKKNTTPRIYSKHLELWNAGRVQ